MFGVNSVKDIPHVVYDKLSQAVHAISASAQKTATVSKETFGKAVGFTSTNAKYIWSAKYDIAQSAATKAQNVGQSLLGYGQSFISGAKRVNTIALKHLHTLYEWSKKAPLQISNGLNTARTFVAAHPYAAGGTTAAVVATGVFTTLYYLKGHVLPTRP